MPWEDAELACEHCGELNLEPDFRTLLDKLHEEMERDPPVIDRAYTCAAGARFAPGCNAQAHIEGRAADLHVFQQYERYRFLMYAIPLFSAIELFPRFIHVEEPKDRGRPYALLR